MPPEKGDVRVLDVLRRRGQTIHRHQPPRPAQAQNLRTPVTSFDRLRVSGNQRVYLIRSTPGESSAFGAAETDHRGQNALGAKSAHSQSMVMGLLKVGRKNLFITDALGRQHELSPMCVLDFYVHEKCQRKG
ncbi:MAG: hypothetical protein BJ554DRAFT_6099, partial [Olpidium bornovanus]